MEKIIQRLSIIDGMKLRLSFIVGMLCLLQTSLFCRQLSFVNSTSDNLTIHIMMHGTQQSIALAVPFGGHATYNFDTAFEHIAWSGYGKRGTDDEYTAHNYVINIANEMPAISEGGALVISSGGEYLYDNKRGGRYGIRFGAATVNDI